jgi:hemerythrin-like domain-containing protein
MVPTDELKQEHQGILLMLRILEKVAAKIESGEKTDLDHLERIVDFFRVFADKCHHGKEEDLLFPAMEKCGISKERGPIGVMLMEHQEGRRYVRGMADALDRYKKGDSSDLKEFSQNARDYISLLTQHINKEDQVLFPMGEKVLPKDVQAKLAEGFEKIEVERIGEGTHEELHKLLEKLEKIYLE